MCSVCEMPHYQVVSYLVAHWAPGQIKQYLCIPRALLNFGGPDTALGDLIIYCSFLY